MDLPIDIHYGKLFDWLVSRQKAPRSWHSDARQLQSETNSILLSLESDSTFSHSSWIPSNNSTDSQRKTYFQLKEIINEILLVYPNRDLLGRASFLPLRQLESLIPKWEKNGLYLSACTQTLVHYVDIELPLLKKRSSRLHSTIADSQRRQPELERSANEARDSYSELCKSLGVPETEGSVSLLLERQVQMQRPKVFIDAAQFVHQNQVLIDAVKLYEYYSVLVSGIEGKENEKSVDSMLPTLSELIQSGDERAVRDLNGIVMVDHPEQSVTIDDGIDWGIDESVDLGNAQESESVSVNGPAEAEEIDWGFDLDVTESAGGAVDIDWGEPAEVEAEESNGTHVAEVKEETKYLEDDLVRIQYLNELCELNAFIERRQQVIVTSNGIQSGMESVEVLKEMETVVKSALMKLQNDEAARWIQLGNSKKYLKRIAGTVEEKRRQMRKLKLDVDSNRKRKLDSIDELNCVQVQTSELIHTIKTLQRCMESSISELFDNRKVNIMGEINTI